MTDVTNASRTMLMNIHTLQWDSELIEYAQFHNICIKSIVSIVNNNL